MLGFPAGADELLNGGALAIAVLGDGEDGGVGDGPHPADDKVPFPELDAPDAYRGAAHGAHVALPEADGHAVVGGDEDVILAVGLQNGHELVPLLQGEHPQAYGANVPEGGLLGALHGTAAGDHEEVAVLVIVPAVEHSGDLLPRLELEDVVQVSTLGGTAGLGDLVPLLPVHPAGAGEEEDIVVAGGGE